MGLDGNGLIYFEDPYNDPLPRYHRERRGDGSGDLTQSQKIRKVAISALTLLSLTFLNILSLGFFTVFACFYQRHRINILNRSSAKRDDEPVQQYVWVEPLYTKREDDYENIEGEFQNVEQVRESENRQLTRKPKSLEAKIFFDKTSMHSLIDDAFDYAFEKFNLSGNSKIYHDPAVRHAVHNWIVYFLIKFAGLERSCDGSIHSLVFNSTLKVSSSKSCLVRSETGKKVYPFHHHRDEWTPQPGSEVRHGTDPVSLKWLLERVKKVAKTTEHLEMLLLHPLKSDDVSALKKAEEATRKDDELAELLKIAYTLNDDISRVMEENFQDVLNKKWIEKGVPHYILASTGHTVKTVIPKQSRTTLPTFQNAVWKKVAAVALKVFSVIGLLTINILSLTLVPLGYSIHLHFKRKHLENVIEKNGGDDVVDVPVKTSVWAPRQYHQQKGDSDAMPIDSKGLRLWLKGTSQLNMNDSMEALLKASFDAAFNELYQMSNASQWGIVFTKSDKVHSEYTDIGGQYIRKYQDTMNTLYFWMTLRLIEFGGLKKDQNNITVLTFGKNLDVHYSNPCHVPFEEGEVVFYLNHDKWSLEEHSVDGMKKGIDPVAAKWLIERLKQCSEEYDMLKVLLLTPLIKEESEKLDDVKHFLNRGYGSNCESVKIACQLVRDIGLTLGKRYEALFHERWEALADNHNAEPLLKENSYAVETICSEVEWGLPQTLPNDLISQVVMTKTLISPIWNNLHDLRRKNRSSNIGKQTSLPNTIDDALEMLSKQYYWIHAGIEDEGCLFSALSVQLSQTGSFKYVRQMKKAMAEYLGRHAEKFASSIEECTKGVDKPGWSVLDYQVWLQTGELPNDKEDRFIADLGELEIELFCSTFNIAVHVFVMGSSFRKEGGMMFPLRKYGPNTKEKIILFNEKDYSFYALMPKLRKMRENDSEEIRAVIRHNERFWEYNHQLQHGQEIVEG